MQTYYIIKNLTQIPVFLSSIETRTRLVYPLMVPVAAYLRRGVLPPQPSQKMQQRAFLSLCARVLRSAVFVQSTYIANSNAIRVPSLAVGAYFLFPAPCLYTAVNRNHKVIADFLITRQPMPAVYVVRVKVRALARCTAMNNYFVNPPH